MTLRTTVPAIARLADRAILGLGVACLCAALAAQGGRLSQRLDLLAHFTPLWLIGALVTAAYGLARRRSAWRAGLIGVGGAGLVATLLLMAPEQLRPIRPAVSGAGAPTIKLIQFNAWEHNANAEGAADWLAAQSPDFVLMDDAEPPIKAALIARGFHYTSEIADTGIFSRAPRLAHPFWIADRLWPFLPSFARATFAGPSGPYSIVAVHLTRPSDSSQMQWAAALVEVLGQYDQHHLIVAGDFNLTPWSFALRDLDRRINLERRDRALATWPARLPMRWRVQAPFPFLPIDHIYAGDAWRTVSIRRGPDGLGSDHYPVVVTLALDD